MRRNLLHTAALVLVVAGTFTRAVHGEGLHSNEGDGDSEVHLAIGPRISGVSTEAGWDTQIGGELHVARLSASSPLATIGVAVGIATFARMKERRLSLDSYAGVSLSSDWTLGVSISPFVDLFPTHRPRFGLGASLWLHAGVAPYVGVTRVWGLGAPDNLDVLIGLRIPFSVVRF